MALGALFVAHQAWEYASLLGQGVGLASGTVAQFFYALTGHGLHVLAGLLALAVLLARAWGDGPGARGEPLAAAVLYWHFVDAVWVGVYAVLYLRLLG